MTFHPMAYMREAERLGKLARIAQAEQDERLANRYRRLARTLELKSRMH